MPAPKARAKFFWVCSLVDKLLTCIRYLRKKSINNELLVLLDNSILKYSIFKE